MDRRPTLLVLGGTTEATQLVTRLAPFVGDQLDLVVSFAGRTARPTAPAGTVRVGGFGGVDGLEAYLRSTPVDLVVDALHPFAAVMPFHAAAACERAGIEVLKLQRPPWTVTAGDRWIEVADVPAAADAVRREAPGRVLLTIGRQGLEPFRSITGPTFLVRSIEPPDLSGAWSAEPRLDRGPFDVAGERELLQREAIDLLVAKNSGGTATAAKLTAARERAVPVVVVQRPPVPSVPTVSGVDDAVAWVVGRVQAPG
ncbi:MAG TPA: cobalt-precorrin-6A reductase [Acidimicrobiales bacterium]|nr:cobalt-precorrin-6A reductase [Acidimicrobiales bacterium]